MPHGGYHGKVVGLGSKPSSRQPGIGQSNTSKPKPKKQNVKSLMTSDTAYKVDIPKKKSTTAVKFDDNTGREKGLQSNISSKELGKKRKQRVLEIIKKGEIAFGGGHRITVGDDKKRLETIKKENLEGALNALMKKIPNKKFNIKDDSVTRYAMKSLGLPINYNQFLYDAFIGTPVFGSDKRIRKSTYKPLTVNDFTDLELVSLKQQAINAIKKESLKQGSLPFNEGVRFRVGGTKELYETLGTATASVNKNGEIIIKDFYDFDTVDGPASTYYIGTEYKDTGYGEPVIARNYAQAISHILINEANKVTKKGVTLGSTNIADNLKTSPNTAEVENSFKQNVRNAIVVLDTTDATQYPKYISDKEELEEQTGQKLLMDLNLGKIQ